jgi:hypothetical protein
MECDAHKDVEIKIKKLKKRKKRSCWRQWNVKFMTVASEAFMVIVNEKVHKIINEVIRSLEGHIMWCSWRCWNKNC